MPRLTKPIILAWMFVAFVAGGAGARVSVVESTPSRVVLSFEMNGFDTMTVLTGAEARSRVVFDGGFAITADSGAAGIPGFPILFGVPPDIAQSAVRVTVEPIELTTVTLNSPIETETRNIGDDVPNFTSRWMSAPTFDNLREHNVARVVLRPFTNLGNRRLRILKRARIIIDLPPSQLTPQNMGRYTIRQHTPRDEFERMISRVLVNYDMSARWARQARQQERVAGQQRRVERQRRIGQQQIIRQQQQRIGQVGQQRAADDFYDQYEFPFSHDARLARFRVGDGNRGGNEGTTHENSIIRISGAKVREIFGGAGGGGGYPSVRSLCSRQQKER